MFTGIVEELGEVAALDVITLDRLADSAVLTVRGPLVATDQHEGDSVAVNGVCLTVIDGRDGTFRADVMAETLRCSALGTLAPGDPVNLERPVPVGGRLGGHIVQGHVDGTGHIVDRVAGAAWDTVRVRLPGGLARYVAGKGSVAVDGVSLTVVDVEGDTFTVGLIPTTLARTTLGRKTAGAPVHIEVDVLAKYVERMLQRVTA